MKSINKFVLCPLAVAVLLGFLSPANFAYASSCSDELAKTEKRWSKVKDQYEINARFERRVELHLYKAKGFDDEGHRVTPGIYLVTCERFEVVSGRRVVEKVVLGCGQTSE